MILDSQNMTEPQVNNDIKTIVIDTNNHNERQLKLMMIQILIIN